MQEETSQPHFSSPPLPKGGDAFAGPRLTEVVELKGKHSSDYKRKIWKSAPSKANPPLLSSTQTLPDLIQRRKEAKNEELLQICRAC